MEIGILYCGHIECTQKWTYPLLMLLVCWSGLYWVGVSIGLCDVLFYGKCDFNSFSFKNWCKLAKAQM